MLKYIVEFSDFKNQNWRIEIDSPDHTGDPISLIPAENPLVLEKNGNTDDNPFLQHIIPTTANITVISTGLDIEELMYVDDASFECRVYYNTQLYFKGYIVSDGIQENDSGVAYDVNIRAIDGLEVLENIEFVWADNYGRITVDGTQGVRRCPMNAIRLALYSNSNLGNRLPIMFYSPYKRDNNNSDMLCGETQLNPRGDLGILTRGKMLNWWVEGILKSSVTWMYQQWGRWFIINYCGLINNDGLITAHEIPDTTSDTVASAVGLDLNIDANDFVNENAFWFGKKPIGSTVVKYNPTTDDNNAVPNGGFDIPNLYWVKTNDSDAQLSYEDSINGRDGYSLQVDNLASFFNPNPIDTYVTYGSIPIDTDVLYKNATLGFKWLPMEGYAVDSDGFIDFSAFPMHIRVMYAFDNKEYYLNEFGYWSDKNAEPKQRVVNTDYISGQQWWWIMFEQDKDFEYGDRVYIQFLRDASYETYSIEFHENMSVEDGINYIRSFIPNTSSSGNPWTLQIESVDPIESVRRAYVDKINDYYKSIEIEEFGGKIKHGDVLDIQFNSSGNSRGIKMPQARGRLSIEIYSKAGSKMRLDDLYFQLDDVSDEYTLRLPSTKNSSEEYELNISSGFSGNQYSSYGDDFSTVNESEMWEGGLTLTELYGREVINMRNKPLRVFSGSIDGIIDWGLLDIKGKKYLPLSLSVNCRDNITDVVAIEAEYNSVYYDVIHSSAE